MQNNRETRQFLFNFFEDIKAQRWRDKHAVSITRTLRRLELRTPVARANRNGQRINLGLFHKLDHLRWLGIVAVFGRNIVLHTGKYPKLAFHSNIVLLRMGKFADLLGKGDVFFKRKVRTVDHNRGEASLDAVLAQFKGITVVKVQDDRNVIPQFMGIFHRTFSHILEQVLVRVLTRTR